MAKTGTAKTKGFREASAQRLPTLICTGYVAAVTDGRLSKSGKYNTVTVEINGLAGSRNTKVFPCTRPEWFATNEEGQPTFNPASLDKVEGGDSIKFVYANNLAQSGETSTLEGLCGSAERFEALQDALLSNPEVQDPETSAEAVASVLDEILVARQGEEPFEIGYKLTQQREKTVDKDEDGKTIYIYTKNYEVSEWFEATEKNKKRYRKIAEDSAEKAREAGKPITFKVCFDNGTPF